MIAKLLLPTLILVLIASLSPHAHGSLISEVSRAEGYSISHAEDSVESIRSVKVGESLGAKMPATETITDSVSSDYIWFTADRIGIGMIKLKNDFGQPTFIRPPIPPPREDEL